MATITATDTGRTVRIPARRDETGQILYACPMCGIEGREVDVLRHIEEKGHDTDPFPNGY